MAKVHFRTNALLKSIIGKDLITDDNIAVLELVKNSFDAGSEKVDIIFDNILFNDDSEIETNPSKITSKLVIKDHGIGMSENDLTEKWLNIAYSEKKEKKEEFGRLLAGNKGVGRFSCDRLGRFLTIYTKVKGGNYNKLFIDWKIFEKEGQIDFNIQDVEFDIESLNDENFTTISGYSNFENGTLLEISGLREHWHSNKIIGLKRQLERLINPNQAFKKSEFGIKISAKEFLQHDKNQESYNKINGVVKNKIFEKLDFRTSSIQSKIDEKGEFITTILQDRGKEIFILKEKNIFSQLSNVDINIFYLNTYAKAYFTKQTGIKSVDFGSIFLFINGFRIPPYGDIGDDWLGMEIRKGQGYNRYLGTREIVGRIEIYDENEKFKIISNRSGVVNNVAFEQLTKSGSPFGFYYKTFRRLERFVVEGINWDSVNINEQNNIESLISSKKWDESKEKYVDDSLTRNKRILSVVNNIIDSKRNEVVDLIINEDFVKEIINEQTEQTKIELENLIKTITDKAKELNPQEINNVLNKISKNSIELENFSEIISKHSVNKGEEFEKFNSVKQSLGNEYQELVNQKKLLEEKLEKEKEIRLLQEEAIKIAEEQAQKIAEELEIEKEKNTYLRATSKGLSEDAKGLVHNIKQTSKQINANIDSLYDAVKSDNYTKKIILEKLSTIKYNTDKVLKISSIITRANFKADKNHQTIDLVKYINQYISIYSDVFEKSKLSFEVIDNNISYIKLISALDIALILDDLISNSEKADAKNILIEIKNPSENLLIINFSDDGKGLDEKFIKNPKSIFELGITTTDGSGIGLNSVKKALSKMQGEIQFLGNGINLEGATFEIIFKK